MGAKGTGPTADGVGVERNTLHIAGLVGLDDLAQTLLEFREENRQTLHKQPLADVLAQRVQALLIQRPARYRTLQRQADVLAQDLQQVVSVDRFGDEIRHARLFDLMPDLVVHVGGHGDNRHAADVAGDLANVA